MGLFRDLIRIVEGAAFGSIIADLPCIKSRFKVLTPDDFEVLASKFETPDAFADRILEAGCQNADEARTKIKQVWRFWKQTQVVNPFGNLHGLPLFIANAIGATGGKYVREVPWGKDMMFGPDCYVLNTPRGGVFLDAAVIGRIVSMDQISTENRNTGLGTDVVEAIRQYAVAHGLGVNIGKVTNPKFFAKFDWLKQWRHGEFKMTDPV